MVLLLLTIGKWIWSDLDSGVVAEHQKSVSPDSEPQKGANLDASVSGGHCWPCLCDAAKTAGKIFIYFKCFYNLYFLQAVRVIQVFVSASFFHMYVL